MELVKKLKYLCAVKLLLDGELYQVYANFVILDYSGTPNDTSHDVS